MAGARHPGWGCQVASDNTVSAKPGSLDVRGAHSPKTRNIGGVLFSINSGADDQPNSAADQPWLHGRSVPGVTCQILFFSLQRGTAEHRREANVTRAQSQRFSCFATPCWKANSKQHLAGACPRNEVPVGAYSRRRSTTAATVPQKIRRAYGVDNPPAGLYREPPFQARKHANNSG